MPPPQRSPSNPARQYEQPAGSDIEKDFDKFPGETKSTGDPNIKYKELPNGDKVVIRNVPSRTSDRTIEIQPANGGPARVKYRYP